MRNANLLIVNVFQSLGVPRFDSQKMKHYKKGEYIFLFFFENGDFGTPAFLQLYHKIIALYRHVGYRVLYICI
jgi:hypothetical protein